MLRQRLLRLQRRLGPPTDCDGGGDWWRAARLAWQRFGTPPSPCPLCGRTPTVFGPPGEPPTLSAATWADLEAEAAELAQKYGLPAEAGLEELHQLLGHGPRR